MNNDTSSNSNTDSQTLLNQIIIDYMKEKKWKNRWRWGFRIIIMLFFGFIAYQIFLANSEEIINTTKPHVGIIDLNGEIMDDKAGSADDFAKGIDAAYKNKGLKALIIRINSPGGSPVQAEYMYNSIKYYKKQYPEVKTYAVCVDLCASAAYYVAAAADEIYASPASMVGSIGVVYNGFGFVDAMQKLGITRRLQTAGSFKGLLDPFSPENEQQQKKLQVMLDIVHKQFINRVKEGRGSRLHIDDETFSGLIWTGQQALDIGLIDGFASAGQLMRDTIQLDSVVDYTHKQNLFDRVSKNLGASMAEALPRSLGLKPGLS
ncbi:MAG: S49 family peptidase [Legionella sp.]|nr:MAG: S49 family peptidase [Legionella sp.]